MAPAGDRDDRDLARPGCGAQPPADLVAVQAGQAEVEQDRVGTERVGAIERLRAGRARRGSRGRRARAAAPGSRRCRRCRRRRACAARPRRRRRGRRAAGAARRRRPAPAAGVTTNSLPRRAPALVATTLPPCISDQPPDQRQADAETAVRALERVVDLARTSRTRRRCWSAAMPMPSVAPR